MTPQEHRDWLAGMTPAMWDHMEQEYRSWAGESERDAAVRDTNHVVEIQSRKDTSVQFSVGDEVFVATRPAERGPTVRDRTSLWGFGHDEWRPGIVSAVHDSGSRVRYSVQLGGDGPHWSFSAHEVRARGALMPATSRLIGEWYDADLPAERTRSMQVWLGSNGRPVVWLTERAYPGAMWGPPKCLGIGVHEPRLRALAAEHGVEPYLLSATEAVGS